MTAMAATNSIDDRARQAGISLARLCRNARVPYRRLYEGRTLTTAELERLAATLAEAEQKKKTAMGTTRIAVAEVASAATPRAED